MKNPTHTKLGLTLTELLVATILVGIVMAGAISVDYGLRNMRSSASKMQDAMAKVSVAMMRLTQDAEQTVGHYSNTWSSGFSGFYHNTLSPNHPACFLHDVNTTPGDYTDDTWVCYTTSTTSPAILYRCENLASPTDQCPGGSEVILNNLITPLFHGFTIVGDTYHQGASPIAYIQFTLQYRQSTAPAHIINNPQVTMTSTVNFPQMSR